MVVYDSIKFASLARGTYGVDDEPQDVDELFRWEASQRELLAIRFQTEGLVDESIDHESSYDDGEEHNSPNPVGHDSTALGHLWTDDASEITASAYDEQLDGEKDIKLNTNVSKPKLHAEEDMERKKKYFSVSFKFTIAIR